jgi:peptidoglycan/LPS O-acetylase OafA/YrhL
MTEIKTDRQHYPALDGVRGIAILLVVFFHNFGFINYFFFGWLGVDLFFVLSGFLITDILIRETGSKNYLKSFYTKTGIKNFSHLLPPSDNFSFNTSSFYFGYGQS